MTILYKYTFASHFIVRFCADCIALWIFSAQRNMGYIVTAVAKSRRISLESFKERVRQEELISQANFKETFMPCFAAWCSIVDFIWETHSSWFSRNWRSVNTHSTTIFLMLHNARFDLCSAIESFTRGQIRGPNLLVKAALEKIAAAVTFIDDASTYKAFSLSQTTDPAWVDRVAKNYPEIRTSYDFIEKHFTHGPFTGFAGPHLVEDIDIDDCLTPPWVDYHLSSRWGTAYAIQSALLVLAHYADLTENNGVNLWEKIPDGDVIIMRTKKGTPFHEAIEMISTEWKNANATLKAKYGTRVRDI